MTIIRDLRTRLINRVRRYYSRVGLQTADPDTLLYKLHTLLMPASPRREVPRYPDLLAGAPLRRRSRRYDIQRARELRRVEGLALIMFMGLGDYLMITPVIRALRHAHPDLPLYTFVSSSDDRVNSSLLAEQVAANPDVDRMVVYNGRPRELWTDYDYRDALRNIPAGFLALPFRYDTDPRIPHRVVAAMDVFGLDSIWPVPRPILSITRSSEVVQRTLLHISERAQQKSAKAVVCCHFEARSSGYRYPGATKLVKNLTSAGYLVFGFTKTKARNDMAIELSLAEFRPSETMGLLATLAEGPRPLYIVSVNTVMWPIAGGLNVKTLGMQIFQDPSVHQYLYPNIFLVSSCIYPRVPASRLFLARSGDFTERQDTRHQVTVTDYDPDFMFQCFGAFTGAV